MSEADYVSQYAASIEKDVTGELLADGLQTLLSREDLLTGAVFWVHCTYQPKYRGYQVEVRINTGKSQPEVVRALVPDQAIEAQTENPSMWGSYMRVFVAQELMPKIRVIQYARIGTAFGDLSDSLAKTSEQMQELIKSYKRHGGSAEGLEKLKEAAAKIQKLQKGGTVAGFQEQVEMVYEMGSYKPVAVLKTPMLTAGDSLAITTTMNLTAD